MNTNNVKSYTFDIFEVLSEHYKDMAEQQSVAPSEFALGVFGALTIMIGSDDMIETVEKMNRLAIDFLMETRGLNKDANV